MKNFKLIRKNLVDSPNSGSKKDVAVVKESDNRRFKRKYRADYSFREAWYMKSESEMSVMGVLQRLVKLSDECNAKLQGYDNLKGGANDFYLELEHPSKHIDYVTLSVWFYEVSQEIEFNVDSIRYREA